ncbi:hypothetical protein [Saccharibacillus sp. JS10]|uniref:hypothetical protein n=1 Tax=Saccharibacillus sp. JS10 TaxID=2950552 RepID=UPI00210864D2|nr:hypothetical protein [Saccharibacillus sp. JS10]MCQ4087705.1 hypothetical protein [Saccharibacillus sp. JS10]
MNINRLILGALLLGTLLLLLAACSTKNERILLVGIHSSKDVVAYNTDQGITDPEAIKKFKTLIESAAPIERKPTGTKLDSDYTVVVNNGKDSTMELGVELWQMEDGTFLIGQPLFGDPQKYSRTNSENSEKLKELLPLEEE